MRWSYGVTAVPERIRTTLKPTLDSLMNAGFGSPRIFMDGFMEIGEVQYICSMFPGEEPFSTRFPSVGAYGNWVLGLWELYVRDPHADRYAIFQDDIMVVRNLRGYLESCPYPKYGFINLSLFPQNESLRPHEYESCFYESNQRGLGALGYVFNREALMVLLGCQKIVGHPTNGNRGDRNIDGILISAMRDEANWTEYVHYPALVEHRESPSTLGNDYGSISLSFPGEEFDAMDKLTSLKPQRQKAIGLYGCTGEEVGLKNYQTAVFCGVEKWLVDIQGPKSPELVPPTGVDIQAFTRLNMLPRWLDLIQVVVFHADPKVNPRQLIDLCNKGGKRIVAITDRVNLNFDPNQIDLLICTTEETWNHFKYLENSQYREWDLSDADSIDGIVATIREGTNMEPEELTALPAPTRECHDDPESYEEEEEDPQEEN